MNITMMMNIIESTHALTNNAELNPCSIILDRYKTNYPISLLDA